MEGLKIGSELAGIPWKTVEKEITWRATTNYAASLSDMNPFYVDDERPEGIIAPPMFAVTLGWPLAKDIYNQLDVPYKKDVFDQQVHYTEYLEFHKPICPGTKILIKPTIAAIVPHKSGTHIVYRFDVTNEKGELHHREYMGCLLRGVECADSGKGAENVPTTLRVELNSSPAWESTIKIPQEFPYIYDGCTGIFFEIHTSPKFARSVGLPDILVQGTATIAFAVREIINREADGNPTRLKVISGKLTAMVFPNSRIKVQMIHIDRNELSTGIYYQVLNERGERAISAGHLEFKND